MKKIFILFLILNISIFGKKDGAKSYLLGDSHGNIYYSKNIDEKLPLASVTKIMTLLITFDELNNHNIKLNDEILPPRDIAKIGGSRIWMGKRTKFKVKDLIKASAVYSANNATQALANYISHGDTDKFVVRMNDNLKKLNIKGIEYHTPTGLPPHMTGKQMDIGSARGLYQLGRIAEKNKKYMKIASLKTAKINIGTLENRNKLLGIDGIYGIKTGHHDTAGYNIVIVSRENGIKLFVVVMGAENEKSRDKIVKNLIEEFHRNYVKRDILNKNRELITIDDGERDLILYPDRDYKRIVKKDSKINIKIIKSGREYTKYIVYIDNKPILKGKLIEKTM